MGITLAAAAAGALLLVLLLARTFSARRAPLVPARAPRTKRTPDGSPAVPAPRVGADDLS